MTPAEAVPAVRSDDRRPAAFLLPVSTERRSKIRFPFELPARYRAFEDDDPLSGVGQVLNMSSGGVLVASRHEMTLGTHMELIIDWPCLLDGRVPLQLITAATVVRCRPGAFAVVLGQREFRTMSRKVIPIDASFGGAPRRD